MIAALRARLCALTMRRNRGAPYGVGGNIGNFSANTFLNRGALYPREGFVLLSVRLDPESSISLPT
jgi:hypothetical protein